MKEPEVQLEESKNPGAMATAVVKSFFYAFDGLFYVMLTQRNMRFHFCMALWVMCFSIILKVPSFEKSFLLMIITFVFAMEILNTCIENLTNLMSPDYHIHAKIAKDTAAAAVLVVSIGSVMAAGYLLMGPFFKTVLDPEFWGRDRMQVIAVAVIVGCVLLFWLARALEAPLMATLIPASAGSAYFITYLAASGSDVIAFFAMMFFSFLIFNSLTKRKTPVAFPALGHAIGALVYAGARLWR